MNAKYLAQQAKQNLWNKLHTFFWTESEESGKNFDFEYPKFDLKIR